jgi:uncharacterized protein YhaN
MRITQLHIENFGGLHDYTEVFGEGLNVRWHPNGWGKSTLAVFIKAMLYGLPATTKRSLIENERKRYTPWQGGVFGGSLDIEVGGECYRIERSFGTKEAEDTLRVVSLRTGRDAEVEWASAPGEGLFGVDAAAYERSTYLSQRPEEMTKDGSVSIHTKLNHLVDATDDLANYDSAMELLEKRRRGLRHLTGGGGEIAEAEERIDALDRDIERGYAQRAVLSACRERIADLKENMAKARAEAEDVQRELSRELKEREGRAVGARLAALQAEEAELNTVLTDCREALGGHEPTESLIETVSGAVAAREAVDRRLSEVRLDEGESEEIQALSERFKRGIPTEEQLDDLRLAARDYNRASVLAMDPLGEPTPEEDLDPEEQYLDARADLLALQKQRHALEQNAVQGKTRKIEPISVVMLALAVAFTVGALWYAFLVIGTIVCLGTALIFAAAHAKRSMKATALAEENKQKIAQLDETIRQAELRVQATERAVRFAKLWRSAYPDEPCPGSTEAALCIERLAAQGERFSMLLEKKKQIELSRRACRHALDEAQAHLLTLMRNMKGAPEDTSRLVRWLTELHSRYREAHARLERKQAEIAALQKECEADGKSVAMQGEDAVDVAALEARQKKLADTLTQWNEALAREEQTEVRLSSDVEELDERESERETLALEVEQKKEQLATIQSAEKYLKEAKERLSGRYLSAIQDSFGRYLGEMTGEDAPVFTMDAQFRVKLRAAGLSRDTDAFSTGTRDLIALCERLSLVDAMFEGERPFLILDDPFTNLDDDTIDRATALVRRVAERYQVLYLTCHSGRAIENPITGEA